MSLIKTYMEREESKELLRDQMDALIDEGELADASLGIAKLLKDKGDIDVLTPKQRDVYDNRIAPLLVVPCDNNEDCGNDLDKYSVADAIRAGREGFCDTCLSMHRAMEKDD